MLDEKMLLILSRYINTECDGEYNNYIDIIAEEFDPQRAVNYCLLDAVYYIGMHKNTKEIRYIIKVHKCLEKAEEINKKYKVKFDTSSKALFDEMVNFSKKYLERYGFKKWQIQKAR
jgi:hypothetical protein